MIHPNNNMRAYDPIHATSERHHLYNAYSDRSENADDENEEDEDDEN